MRLAIRHVHIENFRGIKKLDLDLDDTTVLVGENNTGKSAVLESIRLVLKDFGPKRGSVFEHYDFHLDSPGAAPGSAPPILIVLTFREARLGEWHSDVVGALNRLKVLQVDTSGVGQVVLSIKCGVDGSTGEIRSEWAFLNLKGQPMVTLNDGALVGFQHEVACFYLSALRDAAQHFGSRGQFWRPFLKDTQLEPAARAEIEARLKEINDLVVNSHDTFEQATQRLKRVQDVVPIGAGNVVTIEAVPGRLFDMLSKAQVNLGATTGASVPVGRHGEGTQSLAVLMLFSAFLEAWPEGAPIIALEEPEAHLHPSATRALWRVLMGIHGQKLISTHSGDLLSEVPIENVRRLARRNGVITPYRLDAATLDPDELRQFNFHVRLGRGELLFARCWLLGEGETEVSLLPEVASKLGLDFVREGVRCVNFNWAKIDVYLKVANDLGIQWCVLLDNDEAGRKTQEKVRARLNGGNESEVLHVVPRGNIEEYLCSNGFGDIYEGHLNLANRAHVMAPKGDADYWAQVAKATRNYKTKSIQEVAHRIRTGAIAIPEVLESAVRNAVLLARR